MVAEAEAKLAGRSTFWSTMPVLPATRCSPRWNVISWDAVISTNLTSLVQHDQAGLGKDG
jgi:hypothetical protein